MNPQAKSATALHVDSFLRCLNKSGGLLEIGELLKQAATENNKARENFSTLSAWVSNSNGVKISGDDLNNVLLPVLYLRAKERFEGSVGYGEKAATELRSTADVADKLQRTVDLLPTLDKDFLKELTAKAKVLAAQDDVKPKIESSKKELAKLQPKLEQQARELMPVLAGKGAPEATDKIRCFIFSAEAACWLTILVAIVVFLAV